MILHRVFYDGKPQPRAAGLFGMAFIDPVKPFKYPGLVFRGNADPGIGHGEDGAVPVLADGYGDAAVIHIIFDGVVAEIADDLVQELFGAFDHDGFAL